MTRHLMLALIAAVTVVAAAPALAITTSTGQAWNWTPDAWARGNTADASYFGWDNFGTPLPPYTAPFNSFKLDDSTPELGVGITTLNPRIQQTAASATQYGHWSSSGNYYSGFMDPMFADEVISGTAPASGAGGFTTVVFQVISQPANTPAQTLTFGMDNSLNAWTKQKDLLHVRASGAVEVWQEWTAAGADLPFAISMKSTASSTALDAFQVDTFWTPGNAPAINAIASIPEPATWSLAAAALTLVGPLRRRTR